MMMTMIMLDIYIHGFYPCSFSPNPIDFVSLCREILHKLPTLERLEGQPAGRDCLILGKKEEGEIKGRRT